MVGSPSAHGKLPWTSFSIDVLLLTGLTQYWLAVNLEGT